MARRKPPVDTGSMLYDVVYEDGSLSSNRKVPRSEVDPLDGDRAIRAFLEAQDRKIAEMSGNPRGPIKTVRPSGGK
ncbi:hypothetical protein [Rhodocista pekingensis]|uniref:Uncharacterized protein n=1 Tax=Rhodocista pekingensis TaxID=201185 RepID=A0ABW2L0I0_9PROT